MAALYASVALYLNVPLPLLLHLLPAGSLGEVQPPAFKKRRTEGRETNEAGIKATGMGEVLTQEAAATEGECDCWREVLWRLLVTCMVYIITHTAATL